MSERITMLPSAQDAHAALITDLNARLGNHVERREGSPVYDFRAAALRETIGAEHRRLETPDIQARLKEISDRVFDARAAADTPSEILPRTLQAFMQENGDIPPIHFVTDRDGSLTHIDTHEKEYMLPHGPGSDHVEAHLDRHGRTAFPDAMVRYIQPLLRRRPDIFREAGQHAGTLREGVVELFAWLKENGIPRTVLSANWGELVRGGYAGTPLANDTELTTIAVEHNDISSTDKATKLQLLAAEKPHVVTVYVGDGESDMRAGEAFVKGLVGWIFALKDSPFHHKLTQQGIPHSVYSDYHEIMLELKNAYNDAQELQEEQAA